MMRPTRRGALAGAFLAVGGAALPAPLSAQDGAPPVRVRGRIARLDGEMLVVATSAADERSIRLPAAAAVASLRRVTLAELVPGTQLGVVAEPAREGLRAVAVTVLPPTATRQFQAPWDLGAGSSMNNGPVEAVVQRAGAAELVLTINGRSVPVRIDDRSALVRAVPATRDDLKPGAAVFVNATRQADGALVATRVVVEKDGVVPPT